MITLSLSNFNYASTLTNNSVEIQVGPEKRNYDYGDNIKINIEITSNNRYAKLHYRILDIYSGGGFDALNLDSKERVVDELESSQISIELRDKYYSPDKKRNKGAKAYGLTEKEYEEFTKYRYDAVKEEELKDNTLDEAIDKEQLDIIKNQINATILVFVIIILIGLILIIFIWFIIKSKNSGGFRYMSIIILISLISNIFLIIYTSANKTYAANIFQENVKYIKTISTRVGYDRLFCLFDVKIEYYFVNTIEPITDLELDTDNDTLPDYLEVLYLTDLNNIDTDEDGLFDGIEVYRTYTDPMRYDTDGNKINDGDEDYDGDGLTNLEEKKYETDYDNIDTDFDNLTDYNEIIGVKTKDSLRTYQTNPLSEDTDGDGLRDDTELKLNLNPTNPNDANTKVPQIISTTSVIPKELTIESPVPISFMGNLIGDIDENVKAKRSSNQYYDTLESTVGYTVNVETTYNYNDGLKITFDLSKYSSIKDRIQVCRLIDGKLNVVEGTYLNGNILISDCSSGEYVLIDSMKFLQDMNIFLN